MIDSGNGTYFFLIPLMTGFASHLASAFTAAYSERLGKKAGSFVTIILRDVTGIPLWAAGFLLSVKASSDLLMIGSRALKVSGWILIAAGGILILAALFSIRVKAAAPSADDKLVRTGVYSAIRHPIHTGTALEFAGLFILWPTLEVGISAAVGFFWIYTQSIFEERDLCRRIKGYREYADKTPRFIPHIR
jgi:protein-S-isoprenylcysteine O-methyltransferase Ste14